MLYPLYDDLETMLGRVNHLSNKIPFNFQIIRTIIAMYESILISDRSLFIT